VGAIGRDRPSSVPTRQRKSAAVLSRRDLEGTLFAFKIAREGTALKADLPRVASHAPISR
jgi:hypothetical protein